jgi:hypothetical protein
VSVTRFQASGELANQIATRPTTITIIASTARRARLATTSAVTVATTAAISPPRDWVAASPSTRITTEPAIRKRTNFDRTPGSRPAAIAIDGTIPAAR